MTDHELEALVDRARRSDPDAWEEVYRRSYSRLFSYARRRVPDTRTAEDVVSETMARALASIHRFEWRGGGFDAWLYGIARNVVLESGRAARSNALFPTPERTSTDDGPELRAVASDDARELRSAFARLSADEQELLELRVVGELSAPDVARILGKRPGAVRMAQVRALRHLRAAVEEVRRGR